MKEPTFESAALDCLDPLLGYARHLARNEDEAQDLVQEAYSRVLTYRDKVGHPREARPLLFRILHNLFVDQHRSRQRGPLMIPVEEIEGRTVEAAARLVEPSSPLNEMLKGCLSDEMECALRTLDEGLRETLCLRELEDFTYEEISEILEVPIGTVRSRLSRARRAMARQLSISLGLRGRDGGEGDGGSAPRSQDSRSST